MTNKVYIIGGAQTDFERNWTREGKSKVALLKEVISDALQNTGLSYDDIIKLNKDNRIACFVGNFIAEKYLDTGHLGAYLTEVDKAFYGVPSARYEAACASGSVAIDAAQTKIKAGDYDVAIVVGWELMKTVNSKICSDYLGRAAYYEKECKGIDFPFPALFGKLADEILKKYPSLEEKRLTDNLAMITVLNYENAKRNPLAQTRKRYMSFEQATCRGAETNPYTGGKLAASDCSQITDGAATVILCSEKFIKQRGLKDKPIIKGFGHRTAPLTFAAKIADSVNFEFMLPVTRQTVLDAYKRSGLTVNDIDCFEIHDCFTSSEYASLSCLGIAKPGEEYKVIEDGTIFFDGKKPVNPSGGLIGCGHPVGASGVRMLLDLYKQLTGQAGNYQIGGVKNSLMLNFGGTATTNYVFIVGKE